MESVKATRRRFGALAWALRGGGGGPGVPVGTGGVCEGTGGVGTMGGGVCECMPPCAAAISAMSCADWSPAAQTLLTRTASSAAPL